MASNVVLFGWQRSIPGREKQSQAHFGEFIEYLNGLQGAGSIGSWDVVFLNAHGGDLNGFFLIKGEPAQITALVDSEEWVRHMTRAGMHLDHAGAVTGAAGDLVMERFGTCSSMIPS
jgi:hypothetical protein